MIRFLTKLVLQDILRSQVYMYMSLYKYEKNLNVKLKKTTPVLISAENEISDDGNYYYYFF